MIESGIMRWAGHVAPMGERYIEGFLGGKNLSDRDNLEISEVDARIILRWIFRQPD